MVFTDIKWYVYTISLYCTVAQRLEETLQHQQEDVQGLLEQMRELKQHCEGDRGVHKQVLEDQRKQSEQSVNTAAQLSAQLLDKVLDQINTWTVLQGLIKYLHGLESANWLNNSPNDLYFNLALLARVFIWLDTLSHSLFERLIFMQLASLSHAVQTLTDVFVSSPQEAQLAEALSTAEELRQRYSKQNREKSQLELAITTLNKSVTLSSLALSVHWSSA